MSRSIAPTSKMAVTLLLLGIYLQVGYTQGKRIGLVILLINAITCEIVGLKITIIKITKVKITKSC